jgi:hypothetical protein
MKAQRWKRYSSTLSLTSALEGVGGQRHAPAALPPQKIPGTHFTGGWVGLRAGLDGCGKARPHRESISGPPARTKSLYQLCYPGARWGIEHTDITLHKQVKIWANHNVKILARSARLFLIISKTVGKKICIL